MKFEVAVNGLLATNEQFKVGAISSVQHGNERGRLIGEALQLMAESMGVQLRRPLRIDSSGEYTVLALRSDGKNIDYYGTGPFGVAFSAKLNQYAPRCGVAPGAILLPESGWCRLNHFSAEKMVLDYYAETQTACA